VSRVSLLGETAHWDERHTAMSMNALTPGTTERQPAHTEGTDLSGYKIAAVDGDIGKVDKATDQTGTPGLVVDTDVDLRAQGTAACRCGREGRSRRREGLCRPDERIRSSDAPEYDPDTALDDDYRTRLGGYYGDT
jgi:hypothetical protein